MKRPSIFRQQKLFHDNHPEILDAQPTLSTIYITSSSINTIVPTQHNLSNNSTKMCISIPSTKESLRKCSVDSNDFRFVAFNNFKTEPCKFWQTGGKCPYANNVHKCITKCRFAHGQKQKRHKQTFADLYKTKICKNFFDDGSCPYGARCKFLHQKAPYERQKQYYRKKMSQIHKDTGWFFMDQRRLDTFREIENCMDKENTPTPPSSQNSIGSTNSLKKKGENSAFSLSQYCRTSKKGRHFSICL